MHAGTAAATTTDAAAATTAAAAVNSYQVIVVITRNAFQQRRASIEGTAYIRAGVVRQRTDGGSEVVHGSSRRCRHRQWL